ncbi:MAG: DUF971 domain-containing protein [Ignavibacteria bacterium]|nr:DUF971 domain-containing protein [Ignavibacteria bacterium]
MVQPKKIKRTDNNSLQITWDNDNVTEITMETLREKCPCVSCQGETVLFSSYIPIKNVFKPAGFYEIEKIDKVGIMQYRSRGKTNTIREYIRGNIY